MFRRVILLSSLGDRQDGLAEELAIFRVLVNGAQFLQRPTVTDVEFDSALITARHQVGQVGTIWRHPQTRAPDGAPIVGWHGSS